MNESSLRLFLRFIKGDRRTSREYAESKKNLPISKLDFPLLRYTTSLSDRIDRLFIIRSKITETHGDAIKEMIHFEKTGYGYCIKGIELNIYYEAFLNEIYAIMENVARINLFMFEESHDLPQRFTSQVKRIKNNKPIHSKYDKLILDELEWYNEVNTIRDNVNHYLTGLAVVGRSDDKKPLPQYLNYNMSPREQHVKQEFRIEKDILQSTEMFFKSTMNTLEKIAEIYIELMDKDAQCQFIFPINGENEVWEMSYNDCIQGKKGKFICKMLGPKI